MKGGGRGVGLTGTESERPGLPPVEPGEGRGSRGALRSLFFLGLFVHRPRGLYAIGWGRLPQLWAPALATGLAFWHGFGGTRVPLSAALLSGV